MVPLQMLPDIEILGWIEGHVTDIIIAYIIIKILQKYFDKGCDCDDPPSNDAQRVDKKSEAL